MAGLADRGWMLLLIRHPGLARASLWSVLEGRWPDAARLKFAQQAEQVRQRPPQPADRPGRHQIVFTPRHALEQRVEAGPLLPALGPADPLVLVDGHDGPAKAGRCRLQGVQLFLHSLAPVGGADPDIESDALSNTPSRPPDEKVAARHWVDLRCIGITCDERAANCASTVALAAVITCWC